MDFERMMAGLSYSEQKKTITCLVKWAAETPDGWNSDGEMNHLMGRIIQCRREAEGYVGGAAGERDWRFKSGDLIVNPSPRQVKEEEEKVRRSPPTVVVRERVSIPAWHPGSMMEILSGFGAPKEAAPEEPVEKPSPPVQWEDVMGLEEAKTALREAIEAPYLHKDLYQHFGLSIPKGVLLYGPPGCGKTMLGKAAAAAVAKAHNKPYRDGFFYYSCGEMLGPGWADEANFIKNAFKKAEDFSAKNGYPAVLFFDECDVMLPDRKRANYFVKNAVNIFLSKMDGMDSVSCFIILATNNHHELDEAAIRAGRIDRKIYVGRPDKKTAEAILTSALVGKPMEADLVELVAKAVVELYSEKRTCKDVELHTLMNGAMLKGVADRALHIAFRRALGGHEKGAALDGLGVGLKDILDAVDSLHREQTGMLEHAPKTLEDLGKEIKQHIDEANGNTFDPDRM